MHYNLQTIVEPGAIVPRTAQMEVKSESGPSLHDTDTTTSTETAKATVKLTISHGNVFHPYSKLTILIDSTQHTNTTVINAKIGENNLFEEDCHLQIVLFPKHDDINIDTDTDTDTDTDKKLQQQQQIIGSYNLFKPKSKIYTNNMIGNGNIFHSFCNIHVMIRNKDMSSMVIGNGNIFNSFVSIHETYSNMNIGDDDHDHGNDSSTIPYHNQVFFLLSTSHQEEEKKKKKHQHKLMRRTNDNGVRKNMAEVTLLLSAIKEIIQQHHTLRYTT